MSNTSSAGARRKNSSLMGSGVSQTDSLKSKRGPTSVYSSTLSSLAKSAASDGSTTCTAQHGTVSSGGAARGFSYQAGSRTTAVNGVRGYGQIKTSPRDDVFPDNPKKKDNLKFYSNDMASKPFPGTKIDDMLKKWKGDYHKLEYEHQYIQWLFPLPEGKGLNSSAQPLQQHEAIAIQSDRHLKLRVLRAYRMMLDFYGITLVSSDTGELARADNYKERFDHLNRSLHNYRRITRIIKSIGFLGYGNLQTPFVKFLINETRVLKSMPNIRGSSIHHWIDAIADEKEREETMKMFLDVNHGVDYSYDDYYNVDSADEAMEDVENSEIVDTEQFESACSVETTQRDTGSVGRNSENAFSYGATQRDAASLSTLSDLRGSVRDTDSWDRQSNMLVSVSRTVSSNTNRDIDSSQRNTDLLRSVVQSQNTNIKLKPNDLASERMPFSDPTTPVDWNSF